MDDGDDMDVSPDGVTFKRACDLCRTRKIRCDRAAPCSNCKASKLTCTTTAPTQKAQRQRVHISEQYEKKIDRIEDRLSGIEDVLQALASKLGNLDTLRDSTETSSQSRPNRAETGKSSGPTTVAATPAPFEGETTLHGQSDYAREFLARVVGSTPSIGQNAEIKSALSALGELAAQQSQDAASAIPLVNRSLREIDPGKLDRPPWDVMIHVLDNATKHPTLAFAIIFPFLLMPNLKEIFENAYNHPSSCAAARRVLVYGIMTNLFNELKAFPLHIDVSSFGTYSVWCKRHLEVAISQLDILMPASYENIMALLLGAAQAIGMCKPSLSWTMISNAASMCQNLGYHRINTMTTDTPEMRKSKIHTFWMIYMFDKTLSLRLGRAGVIQDWDISLPFVLPGDGTFRDAEGSRLLAYWVKVARVQGQTYEKLFSPAAFLKSPEERTRTAVELVHDMNIAWYERGETMVTDHSSKTYFHKNVSQGQTAPNETQLPSRRNPLRQQSVSGDTNPWTQVSLERNRDIFFHSNVVVHYSICALIQRAITPDNATLTFNQECLESSRAALLAHKTANLQFNTRGNEELWSGYISWSILQAPFTPFIVVFCNAIQRSDSSDLASMSDFVTSLESCRTISEGADRLYKMSHLFQRIAKLYIQAKKQDTTAPARPPSFSHRQPSYYTPPDETQLDLNAMKEFDPYLSALGLVPSSEWPMPGFSNEFPPPSVSTFAPSQDLGGFVGLDVAGMGLGQPNGSQNSIQEWYSGSRYLMNLMEAADDSQMPDLNL